MKGTVIKSWLGREEIAASDVVPQRLEVLNLQAATYISPALRWLTYDPLLVLEIEHCHLWPTPSCFCNGVPLEVTLTQSQPLLPSPTRRSSIDSFPRQPAEGSSQPVLGKTVPIS